MTLQELQAIVNKHENFSIIKDRVWYKPDQTIKYGTSIQVSVILDEKPAGVVDEKMIESIFESMIYLYDHHYGHHKEEEENGTI